VLDATIQEALRAHFPIHDFGNGYASRNYLKRLPLRKFKTYRWFVNDIHVGDNDQANDAAVLTQAHKPGLRTVDEGGETAKQLQYPKAQGCNESPGYLFANPPKSGVGHASWPWVSRVCRTNRGTQMLAWGRWGGCPWAPPTRPTPPR
jgi:EAL domain-containing protein (putative c-di-GMP-specific phosphodiesterase class I)